MHTYRFIIGNVCLEFTWFEFKNIRNGMHRWHYLPQKAAARIGGMRFFSVWFCNMYFSIKYKWMPWWNFRINTRMDGPNLDTPNIMLKLGVWSSMSGRHQYMLTFNSGASVWLIFPTWMSWQNHWYYIKSKF